MKKKLLMIFFTVFLSVVGSRNVFAYDYGNDFEANFGGPFFGHSTPKNFTMNVKPVGFEPIDDNSGLRSNGVYETEKYSDTENLDISFGLYSFTLEGIDTLNNIKTINSFNATHYSNITDLYPLSKLSKLEEIKNFSTQVPIADLHPLSKLANLKYIDMELSWYYGKTAGRIMHAEAWHPIVYDIGARPGVTDLSPLNNLNKLEFLNIRTSGVFPKVKISRSDRNYTLIDPITLSKHFKTKVQYKDVRADSKKYNVSESENRLVFSDIPENAESLLFTAETAEDDMHYFGEHQIPIEWID